LGLYDDLKAAALAVHRLTVDDAIIHRANAAGMAAVSGAFAILAQRIAALEMAPEYGRQASGQPAVGAAGATLPLDRAPGKP
jgi:hypothetical protein